MAGLESDAAVNYPVQRWLHQRKNENEDGKRDVVLSSRQLSPDVGFASLLHQACSERIRLLNESYAKKLWSGGKSRRELKEVESRFRLFGDVFEHGTLESCLGDGEVEGKILQFLFGVARVLTQGAS